MNELIIAISNLVQGQKLTVEVDKMDRFVFKLETCFGQDAKPFWVITPTAMETVKYHFEKGDLDKYLAKQVDSLINSMDEAVINSEPEINSY